MLAEARVVFLLLGHLSGSVTPDLGCLSSSRWSSELEQTYMLGAKLDQSLINVWAKTGQRSRET